MIFVKKGEARLTLIVQLCLILYRSMQIIRQLPNR